VDGSSAAPTTNTLFYEDFRVGQRFDTESRKVVREDLQWCAVSVGQPSAFGVVLGPWLSGVGRAGTVLEVSSRFVAPVGLGDEVSSQATVTRCRRDRGRDAGLVNWHFCLLDRQGDTVQEGTNTISIPIRESPRDPDPAVLSDFCALPWGVLLRPLLLANAPFVEATQTFDGSFGLTCGRETLQVRVYKGTVLEVARSTPEGPTFTLQGTELAWTRLAFAERNDFIARTSTGQFSVSGNSFEYLRMTKALVAIWDSVRALAAQVVAT
jgi:acyl dehydratase